MLWSFLWRNKQTFTLSILSYHPKILTNWYGSREILSEDDDTIRNNVDHYQTVRQAV